MINNDLQKYLECPSEQVLDVFDVLVDGILQQPILGEELIREIHETLNNVDINKKIRLLQLVDELLASNDKLIKQAVMQHLHPLLTEYYQHQSQTLQSNYLSQEDQVEVIELYIYVNKVLGYFEMVPSQTNRISIHNAQEALWPLMSRPSIILDDNQIGEDKFTQTDDDKDVEKWKQKWELQVRHNQRLQKQNATLRDERNALQAKLAEQSSSEEEQIIIMEDEQQIQQQSIKLQSILKKTDDSTILKKQVQFNQPSDNHKCLIQQDPKQFISIRNGYDPINLQYFKQCCLSAQSIYFDDKTLQILMQSQRNTMNSVQLVFTYLNKSPYPIESLNVKYHNNIKSQPDISNCKINSKQFNKASLIVDDQLYTLNVQYSYNGNQISRTLHGPNLKIKFLEFISINKYQFDVQWNQYKKTQNSCYLYSDIMNTRIQQQDLVKYFPLGVVDENKFKLLANLDGFEIRLKFTLDNGKVMIRLLFDESIRNKGITLIQEIYFIFGY